MTTIYEVLTKPDGSAGSGRLVVTPNNQAWTADGQMVSQAAATTDATGRVEVDLIPTSELIPSGTVYSASLAGVTVTFEVPDSGEHRLLDVVVEDPPGSLDATEIAAVRAELAAAIAAEETARDAAIASAASGVWPRRVFIDGLAPTRQSNWSVRTGWTLPVDNLYRLSSGADGAWIEWDIGTDAGTWTFELLYHRATSAGIIDMLLDGVEIGSVDTYHTVDAANSFAAFSGIAVTAGRHTLRLLVDGKNAASSSYRGLFSRVYGYRTGA